MGEGSRPEVRARAGRTHRLPGPARTVLAVLLLAMAAGQLSDLSGFARILDGYRFIPQGWLTPIAWLLAGVEATAGLALLGHRRSGASWRWQSP